MSTHFWEEADLLIKKISMADRIRRSVFMEGGLMHQRYTQKSLGQALQKKKIKPVKIEIVRKFIYFILFFLHIHLKNVIKWERSAFLIFARHDRGKEKNNILGENTQQVSPCCDESRHF